MKHPQKFSHFGEHPLRKKHASLPSVKRAIQLAMYSMNGRMQNTNWHDVSIRWTTQTPTTKTLWLRRLQQRIVCDPEVLDVLLHKLFCPHQLLIAKDRTNDSKKSQLPRVSACSNDVPPPVQWKLMMFEIPNASTCVMNQCHQEFTEGNIRKKMGSAMIDFQKMRSCMETSGFLPPKNR